MDAATTRFRTKSFFLAAALLAAAAPASAQLQVSTTTVAPTNAQSPTFTVTSGSSTGQQITFSVSANFNNGPSGWFRVLNSVGANVIGSNLTTVATPPLTLYVQIAYASLAQVSGSITLTNTSNASDTQTITVNYVPGGGVGTGVVNATPSSVTLSTSPNNSSQVTSTVTLSTTSGTLVSGSLSIINSNTSYLTLSTTSFSVSASSPFTFNVIGNPFTPAGSYSASVQVTPSNGTNSLNIPITYTSSNGLVANPSSFTLVYPSGNQQVSVTTPGTLYQAYPNVSWLLVNGTTSTGFISSGFSFNVTLNASVAASYPSGTQGTITVQDNANNTISIFVTLSTTGSSSAGVTPSPSNVTISVPSGTTATQSSTVNLSTPYTGVNYSVGWTTNSGGNWLFTSPTSGTLSGSNVSNSIIVYASPNGLGTGTYTGTVTISYSNGYSGSTQIPVTLAVGSSITGQGGLVAPASLSLVYQTGAVGPSGLGLSGSLLVNSTGSWTTSISYSTTNQTWLNVPSSGSTSTPISVTASPTGLQPGTYNATINVTAGGGAASVPVSLLVSNSAVLATNPTSILINNFTAGSSNPSPTNVYVYTSDNSSQAVTATSSAAWITVTPSVSNPTTVAAYLVQINAAGLPNGLNTGTVTFSVSSAANTQWVLPVAIVVSGSTSTAGPLNFSASSLAFNTNVGGTPASQTLTVSSSTASQFTVSANSSGWLSVSPASTLLSTPQTITVSVNTSGLSNNTYTGSLNFLANGVSQSVPVILNVGASTSVSLSSSPGSLSFNYAVGGSTPAAQSINVSASNGGSVVFQAAAATTSGGNWLSLNVNSSQTLTTPSNNFLSASVNPSGLTSGTYNGSITLTSSSAGSLTIPVTLTVTGSASVSATPTTLSFSYTAGGSTPATQAITVNGSGTFSATATSTGNWLSVTPGSGTAPSTVTVSVNPAGLSAGSYNGSVAIAGTGSSTGSTTVSVTLTVTAPLPTITSIANAASYTSGSISPGEVITIFGTAIGPTTPVQLTLTSTGAVSTNIGNVQVLVNGVASPLIYVSSTQISAVVPYAIAIFQTAQVYVNYLGQTSNAVQETVATTAPGMFTANSSGTGPGAILNQNFSVNSPSNPAAKGSVVTLYLTGEGQTSPAGVTGSVTQALAAPPYTPSPLLAVGVTINNSPASIQFVGEAPGIVAGVLQINVLIPANAPTGNLPVQVSIGGNISQTGVTVSVQ